VLRQKGLGTGQSVSETYVHGLDKREQLFDPDNPCRKRKRRKQKVIEEVRTLATSRKSMKKWYMEEKVKIYEELNIKENWQVWNMDETMAALFVDSVL
jgi:hypothetical protein